MIIRLVIDVWELVKGGGKRDEMGGRRGIRAAGFCGPCVYLGVFLLL
jgi:hypothetical protein